MSYSCNAKDCWYLCADCEREEDESDSNSVVKHIVAHSSYDVAASTEAEVGVIHFSPRTAFLGLLQLPNRGVGYVHPYNGYDLYRYTWDR